MASALFFMFNLMGIMIIAMIPVFVILKISEIFVKRAKRVKNRF